MSTHTNENDVATTDLAAPTFELGIASPLTAGPQQVLDEDGNPSALYVGPERVGIGTGTVPDARLTVEGKHTVAQLRSLSGEANLQFVNANDQVRWNLGSGGAASTRTDPTYFLWNDRNGEFSFLATPSALKLFKVQMPNLPAPSPATSGTLKNVMVDPATGTLYIQP